MISRISRIWLFAVKFWTLLVNFCLNRSKDDIVIGRLAYGFPERFPGPAPYCVRMTGRVTYGPGRVLILAWPARHGTARF